MKRIFVSKIFALVFFFALQSFSKQESFVLSMQENQDWMESLKDIESTGAQLAKIRHRMLQDTAVYYNYRKGDFETEQQKTELKERSFKEESTSRPLYIIAFREESHLLEANPEKDKITKLVEALENVSKIEVLKSIERRDFNPKPANYSAIRITIKEAETFKKLVQIIENSK